MHKGPRHLRAPGPNCLGCNFCTSENANYETVGNPESEIKKITHMRCTIAQCT